MSAAAEKRPTMHLGKKPVAYRFDADVKRAALLAGRVVQGLQTLDDEGRLDVLKAIASSFCTRCGNKDPKCGCSP